MYVYERKEHLKSIYNLMIHLHCYVVHHYLHKRIQNPVKNLRRNSFAEIVNG